MFESLPLWIVLSLQVILQGGAQITGNTEAGTNDESEIPVVVLTSSKSVACGGEDNERDYNAVRLGPTGNTDGPWNCWLGTDPTNEALIRSLPE